MSKSIHDLVAFQRAIDLVVDVYEVTAGFPRDERFGLTSQMRRAVVGVSSQIAEGMAAFRTANGVSFSARRADRFSKSKQKQPSREGLVLWTKQRLNELIARSDEQARHS